VQVFFFLRIVREDGIVGQKWRHERACGQYVPFVCLSNDIAFECLLTHVIATIHVGRGL
jgi:sarcosine oxidase delta subunit